MECWSIGALEYWSTRKYPRRPYLQAILCIEIFLRATADVQFASIFIFFILRLVRLVNPYLAFMPIEKRTKSRKMNFKSWIPWRLNWKMVCWSLLKALRKTRTRRMDRLSSGEGKWCSVWQLITNTPVLQCSNTPNNFRSSTKQLFVLQNTGIYRTI